MTYFLLSSWEKKGGVAEKKTGVSEILFSGICTFILMSSLEIYDCQIIMFLISQSFSRQEKVNTMFLMGTGEYYCESA